MDEADPLLPRQIGGGPRHFEQAMMGARAEAELRHRPDQQVMSGFIQRAEEFDLLGLQMGVTVNAEINETADLSEIPGLSDITRAGPRKEGERGSVVKEKKTSNIER